MTTDHDLGGGLAATVDRDEGHVTITLDGTQLAVVYAHQLRDGTDPDNILARGLMHGEFAVASWDDDGRYVPLHRGTVAHA